MAKFCGKCGAPLDENGLCPNCAPAAQVNGFNDWDIEQQYSAQQQTAARASFCPKCGAKVWPDGICTGCGFDTSNYGAGGQGRGRARSDFQAEGIADVFAQFFRQGSIFDKIAAAGMLLICIAQFVLAGVQGMGTLWLLMNLLGIGALASWAVLAVLTRSIGDRTQLICGAMAAAAFLNGLINFIRWGYVPNQVIEGTLIFTFLLANYGLSENDRSRRPILLGAAGALLVLGYLVPVYGLNCIIRALAAGLALYETVKSAGTGRSL